MKKISLTNIAVPLMFIFFSALGIPLAGYSGLYLVRELVIRLSRDSFLALSLIVPILAGMGLNFGMVLGAMAGQIGLIFITDWGFKGLPGLLLAAVVSTPLAILLGYMAGAILNKAKGREMVTGFILAFFVNGLYQLVVLYGMGSVIPVGSGALVLPRGYGIRNAVNLEGVRQAIDNLIPFSVGGVKIPVATFILIGLFCYFITWFKTTKLGQDMRAVGQDMAVADSAGIPVERTRILAIIISTILACYGQIIYLQNIGTLNTYNSHDQVGMFSIASILIGGATVSRASIANVFVGVTLFHLMFIVSPMAGNTLIGSAMLGEYFRVFLCYGIIAVALALHTWTRHKDAERKRMDERLKSVRS